MKKVLVLICGVLLVSGCGKIPALKNGEEAVVSFKKGAISVDDLYGKLKTSYALTTLIQMSDKKILEEEYKKSLDDAKNNAETTLANYEESYGKEFLSALQSNGFSSKEAFKDYLYLNYLQNLAITDYAESKVTNGQINKYYEEKVIGDIKASHILIVPDTKDDMTEAEKTAADDKALQEAKKLIKEIKASKNVAKTFASLAKEYSDDKGSASNGGNLGYFNKGDMVSSFETAALKLKINEYTTTPVKSEHGYHIILKTAQKEKAPLKDVKDSVIKSLGKESLTDNPIYQVDALTELRDKYGFKITDSELKTQYGNYIQNLIASVTKTDDTTTTQAQQ